MKNSVVRREIDKLIIRDLDITNVIVKALTNIGYDVDISAIEKSERGYPISQGITVYRIEEIELCR